MKPLRFLELNPKFFYIFGFISAVLRVFRPFLIICVILELNSKFAQEMANNLYLNLR